MRAVQLRAARNELFFGLHSGGAGGRLESEHEGWLPSQTHQANGPAPLQVCITSLYTVAACSIPQLLTIASTAGKTPSLLVTSGMLAKDPFAAVFPLASSKAGQNSLVHALHKELKSKGVHCALLVVGGTVAEDSAVTNPRNIAEETWKLFRQPQGQGHLALFLDDPAYGGHFKRRGKA